MTLESLQDGLNNAIENVKQLASTPIGSGALGVLGGGALVGTAIAGISKIKKKRRTSKRSKKARSKRRTSKKRKGRYTPRTAGKGKDRSTRRIRHTKTGQPYIILRSGKARFISKRSAKSSRRRKGGRY